MNREEKITLAAKLVEKKMMMDVSDARGEIGVWLLRQDPDVNEMRNILSRVWKQGFHFAIDLAIKDVKGLAPDGREIDSNVC